MFSKVKHRLFRNSLQLSLGKNYCKEFTPKSLQGKVTVVGVPFGKGHNKKGKEESGLKIAPDALRNTGFIKEIQELGLTVKDLGNISYTPDDSLQHSNMNNLGHVAPCIKEVYNTVTNVLNSENTCLVLGGDHSIAAGSLFAHLQVAGASEVGLIYVDAHADINTDTTSESGNIHGMSLALLLQELEHAWTKNIPGLSWLTPSFSLKNVAFIGLRSVDSAEAQFLHKYKATVYTMDEIQAFGIHKILNWSLRKIDPTYSKSIHVSFDIDSLDPLEAPCTTCPVRGGLTLREGIEIAEVAFDTGRLSVIDLVEVNPSLGTSFQQNLTLEAAKHLLIGFFGHCRRGNLRIK